MVQKQPPDIGTGQRKHHPLKPLQESAFAPAKPPAATPKASGLRSFTACGHSAPNAGKTPWNGLLRSGDLCYLHSHLQGTSEEPKCIPLLFKHQGTEHPSPLPFSMGGMGTTCNLLKVKKLRMETNSCLLNPVLF